MAKKTTRKKLVYNHHKVLLLTAVLLVVLLLIGFVLLYIIPKTNDQQRLNRITTILDSVALPSKTCFPTQQSIFGDKRIYSWDSSRSYSSYQDYVCESTVSDTANLIKGIVAKTDFTYYQTPYPGSLQWMEIYKSPKNEYLRIEVSSKLRDDAFFNDEHTIKKLSDATLAIDPNSGPSTVTIKVNLDDNNE